MSKAPRIVCSWTFLAFAISHQSIHAQALPTATRELHLSSFAGLTGSDTGLNRNLGFTLGADLGFPLPIPVHPSLEIRGTLPLASDASAIRQRNLLAGLRVDRRYGRLRPYADLLAGRNQTNYDFGVVATSGNRYFVQSVATVVSPGVGVDLELSERFSLKLDAQFQRYSSPVANSGHLFARSVTLGTTCYFSFDHRH